MLNTTDINFMKGYASCKCSNLFFVFLYAVKFRTLIILLIYYNQTVLFNLSIKIALM